jgi:hypothetical protein
LPYQKLLRPKVDPISSVLGVWLYAQLLPRFFLADQLAAQDLADHGLWQGIAELNLWKVYNQYTIFRS